MMRLGGIYLRSKICLGMDFEAVLFFQNLYSTLPRDFYSWWHKAGLAEWFNAFGSKSIRERVRLYSDRFCYLDRHIFPLRHDKMNIEPDINVDA